MNGTGTSGLQSLCIVALLGLVALPSAVAQKLRDGDEFPNFKARCVISEKDIELKQFRGKVVLVDFWATWCGPCLGELPHLKEAYEKYHKKGFEIISISLDNSLSTCKSFVKKEEMKWYHVCDGRGWSAKLAKKHQVNAIPFAVLVGKDGKILTTKARGEALAKAIEKGLEQKYDGPVGETEEVFEDDIERDAREHLSEADRLRAEGKVAEALELYDEIGVKYAARPVGKDALQRARLLREDPDMMKQIEQQKTAAYEAQAEKEAGGWLKLARQTAKLKKYDLSRKYYQRIIDKYPKSHLAEVAKTEMERLPKQ